LGASQRVVAPYTNRDPDKSTEFLELIPPELYLEKEVNELKAAKRFDEVARIETMTVEYNVLLIRHLVQLGFTFKVLNGIASSEEVSAADNPYLKAELETLEALNVKWNVISEEKTKEVLNIDKGWGRPRGPRTDVK